MELYGKGSGCWGCSMKDGWPLTEETKKNPGDMMGKYQHKGVHRLKDVDVYHFDADIGEEMFEALSVFGKWEGDPACRVYKKGSGAVKVVRFFGDEGKATAHIGIYHKNFDRRDVITGKLEEAFA